MLLAELRRETKFSISPNQFYNRQLSSEFAQERREDELSIYVTSAEVDSSEHIKNTRQ